MLPSAADAYTALQAFKMPDAQSVVTQAQGQYGVPDQQKRVSDLRSTVNNLQSSLNAVDPSVTGRTTGTFTTEAQRQALVNKEQTPVASNLNEADRNLGVATGDLSLATGNAGSLASTILAQNQSAYQKLLDQYNASSAAEKEAEAKRQFEEQQALEQSKLAESKREFDNPQSTNNGIDLSKFLGAFTGSGSSSPSPADALKSQATNAIVSLFSTGNDGVIRNTVSAIKKSAGYGNSYDQLKLQLIQALHPEYLGPTKAAPARKVTAAPVKNSYTSVLGINNPYALKR